MGWKDIHNMILNRSFSDAKQKDLVSYLEMRRLVIKPGGNHLVIYDNKGNYLSAVPLHRTVGKGLVIAILKQCRLY